MSQQGKHSDYRFERKFLTSDLQFDQLEQIVRSHPGCFREIFYIRQVNNMYFDTPGLKFFHDNVSGSASRTKVRIRWYGEANKQIARPVLEFKYKEGLVGRKSSYLLNDFELPKMPGRAFSFSVFQSSDLPGIVLEDLKGLEPVLINSYQRKYFISFDSHYRFTIDKELRYCDARWSGLSGLHQPIKDSNHQVLELKYNQEYDDEAGQIIGKLPMRITKSSKYVSGLYLIRPDLAV